jgi:hypothetical protein
MGKPVDFRIKGKSMITYSLCMDCQKPLGWGASAGCSTWAGFFRFDLSHGLCERCKDKRLAELREIQFQREGLALRSQSPVEQFLAIETEWREHETKRPLARLLKECGI